MGAWRAEVDRQLALLERAQGVRRGDVARVLAQLTQAAPGRAHELAGEVPRLLADPVAEVRRAGVVLAALALEHEAARAKLSEYVADPDRGVRLEAVGRLADLGEADVRPVLAQALEDPQFEVRFEAARGMAALRHPAGMEVLVAALDVGALRFRALGSLAELGDARAVPAIRRIFQKWLLPPFERTQAAGALAKLGDTEAAQHLFKRIGPAWAPDRALAVELLGEVKAPGAFERLSELLRDAKDPSRGAAARGLGRLGDVRALPLLLEVLDDRDAEEDVRLDAAEGLWTLGTPEARERVLAARDSFETPEAREELADLLAPEDE